ncbi:hypothetical protein JT359_13325 [Candidatus Poribacteria bacterium]|nr:hypothetical protein [Candidatus Poribacteria bacterium]
MTEGKSLFDWDYTEFIEVWSEKNITKFQQKFGTSPVSLSQSLLISEETSGSYWLISDFKNEKTYNLKKVNETTVEISEGSDLGNRSDILNDAGTIVPRLESGIGTDSGIIDALKRINFNNDNLENLIRPDLSDKRLSFESVYPELEVTYKMLVEILTSPRNALVSLSSVNVQQLKNHVLKSYDMTKKIIDFGIGTENENIREQHDDLSQEINDFCNEVKNSLLQVVAYLSSRNVEQLRVEFKKTVTDAEEDLKKVISDEVDKLQQIGGEINEQQAEVLQKSEEKFQEIEETHLKYQNQLTEKPISQYKEIFAEQSKKHRNMAWVWLGVTSVLALGFCYIFWWLLTDLQSAVSSANQFFTIFSNLFAKGFFLSLILLLLNRSIKNFAAEKHLEVVNTHRQNALETFDTFVAAAEGNRETRDAVLLAATKAIFDANQSGYLSAKSSSSDTASPVQQIIKEVIPSKSSSDSD